MAKAPICILCRKWSNEGGGSWFQFKVVKPEEIEHNSQFSKPVVPAGDRAGNWFFCREHEGFGWKYRHLTWEEAAPVIKELYNSNKIPKAPLFIRILEFVLKIISKFSSKN